MVKRVALAQGLQSFQFRQKVDVTEAEGCGGWHGRKEESELRTPGLAAREATNSEKLHYFWRFLTPVCICGKNWLERNSRLCFSAALQPSDHLQVLETTIWYHLIIYLIRVRQTVTEISGGTSRVLCFRDLCPEETVESLREHLSAARYDMASDSVDAAPSFEFYPVSRGVWQELRHEQKPWTHQLVFWGLVSLITILTKARQYWDASTVELWFRMQGFACAMEHSSSVCRTVSWSLYWLLLFKSAWFRRLAVCSKVSRQYCLRSWSEGTVGKKRKKWNMLQN